MDNPLSVRRLPRRKQLLRLERLERRLLLNGTTHLDDDIDLNTGTDTGPDGVVRIFGDDQEDWSGWSVSGAGDVDDDGYDDFLVSAHLADTDGGDDAGEVYLVFGREAVLWGDVDLDTGTDTGPAGVVRILGDDAGDWTGWSVSGAGDVNNDGYDDFLIGAGMADNLGDDAQAGVVYLVFGRERGLWADVDLDTGTDTGPGGVVRIFGDDAWDRTGWSVGGVGDVDDDGYHDILIGAYGADPGGGVAAGESYLIFGRGSGDWDDIDLDTDGSADPDGVVRIFGDNEGDQSGQSVSAAGDVNGDGYDDFLIGAYAADPDGRTDAGETYLVFGRTRANWDDIDLDTGTGAGPAGVVRILGDDAGDASGISVSGAGDVNADGYDDILVGAYLAAPGGAPTAGEAYLIFGRDSIDWTDIDLDASSPPGVIHIYGDDAVDWAGLSVSGAGDVNSDGYDDFLVSGYGADPDGGTNAGEAYLIFGRSTAVWADVDLNTGSSSGPPGVVRIFGDDEYDYLGRRLSGAGDVDGDGYADFLISAYAADPAGGVFAGETYLIFGDDTSAEWLPDLTVSDVGYGYGIYAPGTMLTSTVDLANVGPMPVAGPFDVAVYLSSNTTLGDADDILLDRYMVAETLSGETSRLDIVHGLIPQAADWGSYYVVCVVDGPDVVLEGDEANNEWWSDTADIVISGDMVPVAQFRSADTLVSVYDVDGGGDVDPDNVSVKFGKNGSVSSIKLGGYLSMEGLGIVISGAPSVGSIKDSRKGAKGDIAFIASDSYVKSISLKSELVGHDLNGLALGGIAFDDDIDGDGVDSDATAIYGVHGVGSVTTYYEIAGDIWVAGADSKGRSLKSLTVKYDGMSGDLFTSRDVRSIKLGGDLASTVNIGGSLSKLTIKGGDLTGDVTVDDFVGKVSVSGQRNKATGQYVGGSVTDTASLTINGSDSKGRSLNSLATKYGGFHGDLTTDGAVSKLSFQGDVGSSLTIGGYLSKLQIKGGDLAGELHVSRYVGKISVAGSVTDTADVMIDGQDSRGRSLQSLVVKSGDFDGALTCFGDVSKLSVSGGDFSGALTIGDELSSFQVKGRKGAGGALLGGADVDVDGLLKTLKVAAYQTDNGGVPYGVSAGSFGKITLGSTRLEQADLPFIDGDFSIVVG